MQDQKESYKSLSLTTSYSDSENWAQGSDMLGAPGFLGNRASLQFSTTSHHLCAVT